MPIGNSGRVVIEMDPELKRQLHELVRQRGMTLKDWFLVQAVDFVANNSNQLNLGFDDALEEEKKA